MPSVSEPGDFCTNGMSLSRHDSPFANSGLVVTVPCEEFGGGDVLAGVRLQQSYERRAFEVGRGDYLCPIQRAADFLAGRPTKGVPDEQLSARGGVGARSPSWCRRWSLEALRHGLPIMDRRWRGRFLAEATLVGPEARGSAPVRIPARRATRETPGLEGLYPVGEGAGYAGGIVSAAVDGLRTAKAIIGEVRAAGADGLKSRTGRTFWRCPVRRDARAERRGRSVLLARRGEPRRPKVTGQNA